MLDMQKFKNGHNYDCFLIQTDEGEMVISFEGNFDLYWRYIHCGSILDAPDVVTLTITKENYQIYEKFDLLYQNVLTKKDRENLEYHSSLTDPNNPYSLIKGKSIVWHSDEFEYDKASKVSITPGEDVYYITFEKSKDKSFFITFAIRFRNSGSRYNPYNIEFMHMYNNLKTYDPDNLQIHMEEYLFHVKKRSLTKEEK